MNGNPGLELRRLILGQSYRAGVGHIGSSLSIADIMAVLFGEVIDNHPAIHAERDRFVLGKGHAALALYCALHLQDLVSRDQLDTFCADDSLLGVHPQHALAGVDFTTGSLGQGLSYAVGSALAARLQGSDRRVYALLSDAECNEGAVWEAAQFAAHHHLGNLVAIVDVNGQQALGYTRDIIDTSPMGDRWRAFGWSVHEVDGHDGKALSTAFMKCREDPGAGPHVLVATTTFGKGVSYMEGQVKWHYSPMSKDEYASALAEVNS